MSQSAAARALPPHLLRSRLNNATTTQTRPAGGLAASRSSSRRPGTGKSSSSSSAAIDYASTQATASLIRRVLCPPSASVGLSSPQPWQEQLPRLTSSVEVDEQLYAIIAIIIKEFVSPWYGKITPDHQFTNEVVAIVAQCTKQLEARALALDWVELLGDELAALLVTHVNNYHMSHEPSHRGAFISVTRAYHALDPHPALTPPPETSSSYAAEGHQPQEEAVYRQLLIQSALAVLLPKEDIQNPTIRILVADVVADLILGKIVLDRLCEGWLIWEGITRAILIIGSRSRQLEIGAEEQGGGEDVHKTDSRGQLERSGLLETTTYQGGDSIGNKQAVMRTNLPGPLWRLLAAANYIYLAMLLLGSLFRGLYTAASLSDRASVRTGRRATASNQMQPRAASDDASAALRARGPSPSPDSFGSQHGDAQGVAVPSPAPPINERAQAPGSTNGSSNQHTDTAAGAGESKRQPILLYAAFAVAGELLQLRERMPWLAGVVALVRHHLLFGASRAGDTNGPLDKYLYQAAQSAVSKATIFIPRALLALRTAVFPNNVLSPARQIPSEEQRAMIRREATDAILGLIPPQTASMYFGQGDELEGVEKILDVFSDKYCNKHLVLRAVELVLVRLLPEVAERTTEELLKDRIGA